MANIYDAPGSGLPRGPNGLVLDASSVTPLPVQPFPNGAQFASFGNQASGAGTQGYVAIRAHATRIVVTTAAAWLQAAGGGAVTFEMWLGAGGAPFAGGTEESLNLPRKVTGAQFAQGNDISVLTGAASTLYALAMSTAQTPVPLPVLAVSQLTLAIGDAFVLALTEGAITYEFALSWVELPT